MIETMRNAVCAILQEIEPKTELDTKEIDYEVFHGMADEHLLKTVLKEMKADELLDQTPMGNYGVTSRGMMYIEQNCEGKSQ